MARPLLARIAVPLAVLALALGVLARTSSAAPPPREILFVGDSLIHGKYEPVRSYGATLVKDENFGRSGARAELEPGPWGGIAGIFAQFARESNLAYDVHLDAISATPLSKVYAATSDVIDRAGWDDVILQEYSTKPLPFSLTGSTTSDPAGFDASVARIERAVHAASPAANVFLYETWPRGDVAMKLAGAGAGANAAPIDASLTLLGNANRDAYAAAARADGHIAGIAPVGVAWQRAWTEGIADPVPGSSSATVPSLWYGIHETNDPAISKPDYLHPSVYGAYLSALVLFGRVSALDVRTLGANESAARDLGIDPAIATRLQNVAYETVSDVR